MKPPKSLTYKDCGVDVEATDSFLKTKFKDITKFCSLLPLPRRRSHIAMSCDGVGTKLLYTHTFQKYDTIGIDLVAMIANDLITSLASPAYFMDYIACSQMEPALLSELLKGIEEGCRLADMTLVGGETAEMPDLYDDMYELGEYNYGIGMYDLAGFGVGFLEVEHKPAPIMQGDVLVGFPSSGLHSNGFSLVRNAIPNGVAREHPELLTPTRIYVDDILSMHRDSIKAVVNITGGGLNNINRVLPEGLTYKLNYNWAVPEVCELVKYYGYVTTEEMYRVFNMGIGMVVVVPVERYYPYRDSIIIGHIEKV